MLVFVLTCNDASARERFNSASVNVAGYEITCETVRNAMATWPRAMLNAYRSQMTVDQLRLAKRCLGKSVRR